MTLLPCSGLSSSRVALITFTVAGLSVHGACVEPTNPCDPDADPALQAQGTRITGTVVDQDGVPVPGVPVGIAGRVETLVSGEGGVFEFTDISPGDSHEILASPAAPVVGGRTKTGPLVCGGALDDVEVRVVVPPDSPEVEIVRASGDRRVFAAFGAVGGEDPGDVSSFFDRDGTFRPALDVARACDDAVAASTIAYRVQVRAPFGAWEDAVLAPFPWIDPPGEVVTQAVPDAAYLDRVDDTCAKALCAQFAYLEPELENDNARCVDVVGVRGEDGGLVGLEPYGTYQVRVLSELRTPDALRETFALPERVLADAPALPGQMTLLPGALLPVVGADGLPRDVGDVSGLVTTAGGRFALLEDATLSVIGDGGDTLDDVAQGSVGESDAPQGAFGEDAAATDAMAGDFSEGNVAAAPVAILPAGDWVRVVRRLDDGTGSIEKVYVGDSAAAAVAGPAADEAILNADEPTLPIDPLSQAVDESLRSFAYLVPDGVPAAEQGSNPRDAYVLLYGSAFVLVEQGRADDMVLDYFANVATRDIDTGDLATDGYADGTDGQPAAAAAGACGAMAVEGDRPSSVETIDGAVTRKNVSVCYDLGAALADDVDLRDVEVLGGLLGERKAVMSDAANDRLFVARQSALTCEGCIANAATPLAQQLDEVRVGREPLGLLSTRVLDCGGEQERPVLLVANHGSGDLSVVEDIGGEVRETGVVALPAAPVGFLDDPIGATCADPFIWVIADDGRVVPVDMRGEPSVPLCNGVACDVGTRGRGSVGAVARSIGRPARGLVGGNGLLGELGFFRPRALKDAAYLSSDDMVGEATAPSP